MLIVLAARGFYKIGSLIKRWLALQIVALTLGAIYFGIAWVFYIPFRLNLMQHIYSDTLTSAVVVAARQADLHQALIFQFADDWPEAAAGIMQTDPDLQNDLLYPRYISPDSYQAIVKAYPDRAVYFWREGQLSLATDPPPDWQPAYPTVRYPNP